MPMDEAKGQSATRRRFALGATRAYHALAGEALIIAVLVGSFLARWLIADRNSYWLDELYSVAIYGIWNDSAVDAVGVLARTSVHPPLYQFMLYNWMDIFGDDERATRSLSNVYITLAALFLYLLVRSATSRRTALISTIAFSLMYAPTYYALETRSYAQTIFFVTLSSFALLRMMRVGVDRGWRAALVSLPAVVFTSANVGLLLTHYYNAFFLVAQGAMAGLFVIRERPRRAWVSGLAMVAALYGLQGAIFALVWGDAFVAAYRRRAEDFEVEGSVRSPLDLLGTVVEPNFDPPFVIFWLFVVLALVALVRALLVLARRGGSTSERLPAWTAVYLFGWLILPLLVVYVAFIATGVARYSPRYWLFIMPPLAPLVVLAIEEAPRLVADAWHRLRLRRIPVGAVSTTAGVTGGLVILTLILPGALAGATAYKADWRGTAEQIYNIVESNPDSDFVIYEPSFRPTPVLDYYLHRYSRSLAVAGTIRRSEERSGNFRFVEEADEIQQHDFLIVPFIHQKVGDFPKALAILESTYPVQYRDINRRGRGLVVFAVSGGAATTQPLVAPEAAPVQSTSR